jgi:hypothetical protein
MQKNSPILRGDPSEIFQQRYAPLISWPFIGHGSMMTATFFTSVPLLPAKSLKTRPSTFVGPDASILDIVKYGMDKSPLSGASGTGFVQ